MTDELVVVGRVGKAHGLKGEVSVQPWTDDPDERFRPGTEFITDTSDLVRVGERRRPAAGPLADADRPDGLTVAGVSESDPVTGVAERLTVAGVPGRLTVAGVRAHSGRWLLSFTGIEDRTAAEALRGIRLLLPARQRPALPDPDDFYDSDLIGLRAIAPDGVELGRVSDVVHAPGGEYLVLLRADGEHLVPFVASTLR